MCKHPPLSAQTGIKMLKKIEEFRNLPPPQKLRLILPYLAAAFLCTRIAELYRTAGGDLEDMLTNFSYVVKTVPRFNLKDLLAGSTAGCLIVFYIKWEQKMHRKNARDGEEYGSARWGTAEDIKPFIDEDPYNNIILSKTEMLTMNPKMKDFRLNRNKHVMVIGGSGSGKTYTVVKPNLFQCHSSYVVSDPKGTLLPETGKLFERMGYNIYVLDTIDMAHSMHYNPFAYIRRPQDIVTLATALYTSLKPPNSGTPPDPFFDQAAMLWLQCMIGYLWYEAPPEEQTIPVLLQFLEADEVREDEPEYQNAVDLIFSELEKEKGPRHFAVKQRKKYKLAAGKTAKSILISVGSYFSRFDIPEVADIFSTDDLHLDTYGDKGQKSILYLISSDTDSSFNFILTILFTQIFNVLCYKADKEMGGKLDTPVQFIIDEFANIPQIPDFKILISTVRSRLISIIMMLQTQSQLKDNYKEAAETISGNCDTTIFLGGQEKTTLKDMEEALGDETIDLWTENSSYSQSESHGINFNKTGRKLKNVAELNLMDRNKCIVRITGLPPFLSDKYNTSEHPRFRYTSDAGGGTFDLEKYMTKKRRKEAENRTSFIKMHPDDVYRIL